MASATRIWEFTGDAEGLADSGNSAEILFAHEPTDGVIGGSVPAGCVKFTATSLVSQVERAIKPVGDTWESLFGIPAGSTIIDVQLVGYYSRLVTYGGGLYTLRIRIVDSDGVSVHAAGDLINTAISNAPHGWTLNSAGALRGVNAAAQASNTPVRLQLEFQATSATGPEDFRLDKITIAVTYITGSSGAGGNQLAQSGLPTSVGLAIESAWRTVPVTAVSGADYDIGIAGTNPHRFMIVEPGGGFPQQPEVVTPDDEIDGDIELKRSLLVYKPYDGEFGFKADGENLLYPLYGILGKNAAEILEGTTTPQSADFAIKHVFTPNKYAPSFTLEEGFGDKNYGRLNSGVVVQRLALDFGKVVTARMGLYAGRQIPNRYPNGSNTLTDYDFTSTYSVFPNQMGGDGTKRIRVTQNPTYVDVQEANNSNGPFCFGDMTFGSESGFAAAFLKIDDVAIPSAEILEGLSISLERDIERFMVGGSGYDVGACVGNGIRVSGNLQLLFKDNSIPLAVFKHSKLSLNFKLVGVQIGSSAEKYTLEVHLPNLKFLEGNVSVPAGAIMAGGSFRARKDPALGYSIKLTLINATNVQLLSGSAGTTGAAGGLGGHNTTVTPLS